MFKRKRKKMILTEMAKIEAAMQNVRSDSEAYRKLQERYISWEEEYEKINSKKGIFDTIYGFFNGSRLWLGTLALPVFLAVLSYDSEGEMKSKIGGIWNLIGRDFNAKDK